MGTTYKMTKTMYDDLRFTKVWDSVQQKMITKGKPLTKKEVLELINKTFGLIYPVIDIVFI